MYKILSVDDEPINQAIVKELFSAKFDVALASSGEECLQNIATIKADLILLDVSMAGMDGYDTCRELKKDASTRHVPIIFVSARGSLEDKIKAYEAGGYDYITKPFNHSELESKIKHTIETAKQSENAAKQENNSSYNSATISPPTFEEAEIINQFLSACCASVSLSNLGVLLLNTCQELNLDCSLQFRTQSETCNFSTKNEISPLEQSLFEQTKNRDRCFDFNSTTIMTYPHISLLIKNMPVDDSDQHGGLKNLLGILMGGIESRIKALINETALY